MYAQLATRQDRQRIAQHFGLNEVVKFKIAKIHQGFLKCDDRFYTLAVVAHEILRQIAPGSGWHVKLESLFKKYPNVNIQKMGFPLNWRSEPFWNK
jgi:hypothetical protein